MAKNIHFNEFELDYNNGVCQLNSVQPFKKRLPYFDRESIWKFVRNRYYTGAGNRFYSYAYIIFITDDKKVKGYCQMTLPRFCSFLTEAVRIILMGNVEKVVFVINFNKKIDENDELPKIITKAQNKLLSTFEIEVLDSLVIDDERYFSLKENSLI